MTGTWQLPALPFNSSGVPTLYPCYHRKALAHIWGAQHSLAPTVGPGLVLDVMCGIAGMSSPSRHLSSPEIQRRGRDSELK